MRRQFVYRYFSWRGRHCGCRSSRQEQIQPSKNGNLYLHNSTTTFLEIKDVNFEAAFKVNAQAAVKAFVAERCQKTTLENMKNCGVYPVRRHNAVLTDTTLMGIFKGSDLAKFGTVIYASSTGNASSARYYCLVCFVNLKQSSTPRKTLQITLSGSYEQPLATSDYAHTHPVNFQKQPQCPVSREWLDG